MHLAKVANRDRVIYVSYGITSRRRQQDPLYGAADPLFADTLTGFVNGENSAVVSGIESNSTPGGDTATALASLEPIANRLAFLNVPYSLEHVAEAGTAFKANVMILDYIERFAVGDATRDKRE